MSYLAEYDSIPMERAADKVKLVYRLLRTDQQEFYKELRENRPILITPAFILITLFKDVQEVLSREEVFSVRLYQPKIEPSIGLIMLSRDNTEINWREKSILKSMLQLEELPAIRKMCGEWAKEALNKSADTGKIEVVNEVARYVPVRLCGDYFGFPGPDLKTIYRWSKVMQHSWFKNLANDSKVQEASVEVGKEIKTYLRQLLEKKKRKLSTRQALKM